MEHPEWGVYGDGGGEAYFGPNTTLQAQTALTSTSSVLLRRMYVLFVLEAETRLCWAC